MDRVTYTWYRPEIIALSEAFMAILHFEYCNVNIAIEIELVPLNYSDRITKVFVKWRSPSSLEHYKLLQRFQKEFRIMKIVVIPDM
jgi:phosphoenolpyruvate synthase/pyruvate phosphate dikinase